MNTEIENYTKLKKEIIEISKEYQTNTKVELFHSHIDEKLNNFNPTIMVYGVYNAGKSTLLNAIFGKDEMAKTGDAPQTAKVSAYTYNGYTIYDTPGINAPIIHQQITDEHLNKCELVIFVLSNNGSFEERYIYEKIGKIIKANKPILIAMNNKSGIDMNSLEGQNEIYKVNQHLSTVCDELGIKEAEKKVKIAFVDAKTALEGKLENEQELINESKIEEFEEMMEKLLGDSGKQEVVNALNLYISNYIQETLTAIDEKINNPQIKKTQELITYFDKMKHKVRIELKDLALQTVNIATAKLFELMLVGAKREIDEMIAQIIHEINQKIKEKIEKIQDEMRTKINQFTVEFEKISIDTPRIDTPIEEAMPIKQTDTNGNYKTGMVRTVAITVGQIIPPTVVVPTPLGPIPLKPIVMAVGTIVGLFFGSNEGRMRAEAQIEEKRLKHMAAQNKADSFGIDLKDKLFIFVDQNIENTFDGVIFKFEEFSRQLETKNNKLLEDKKRLQIILSMLQV